MAKQLVIVLGLAAAFLGSMPTYAQVRWEMTTEYPSSNISGEGVSTFARLIAERAGGRLVISPSFDASSGITAAQMVEAARAGHIQAADAFAGPMEKVDPVFAISSLPFLVRSFDDAKRLSELARPRYRDVLAQHGSHLLYVTIWPSTGLWSKQRVAQPADLHGLMMRTYDSNSAEVMKLAGANAEYLPFGEALAKLKAGRLDAILSSGDGGAGRRLWDDLPNFTAINYAIPVSVAFVQSAAYDALPPDLQGIVDQAARDTEVAQWASTPLREEQNYMRMRANKVAIADDVSPTLRAVFTAAAKATIEAWRKGAGPEALAVLERLEGL